MKFSINISKERLGGHSLCCGAEFPEKTDPGRIMCYALIVMAKQQWRLVKQATCNVALRGQQEAREGP